MATLNGGRPIDRSSGYLVISGVPGAGKTTVAGVVTESLPRSAVPDADALARMVSSGWVGPVGEPADQARAHLMLRTRNVRVLAGSFAEAGFFPIIDQVVADRAMPEAMLGWLEPRPVWFVTVAPDLSTARARNRTRPATCVRPDDADETSTRYGRRSAEGQSSAGAGPQSTSAEVHRSRCASM